MIFFNYTNHCSNLWSKEQLKAANEYGTIVDMPFTAVDPEYGEEQISELAAAEADKIIAIKPNAVLCQGEMSLAYSVINILKAAGITVLCATANRITETEIKADGSVLKKVCFRFVRFRKY